MIESPRPALLAAGAALAALAVILPALGGPFIFDDVALIPGNHYVHDLSHFREWFVRSLWDTNYDVAADQHRTFWRPLVVASYALDWQLGGGSPLWFHATNAVLHATNAALVFYVLSGWVQKRGAAAAGALIFALHPVQTEVAAWIAGRTDALCMLGLLVATLSFRARAERRWLGLALRALGLTVAFLSKETAVVFPVFVALESWAIGDRSLARSELVRIARTTAPFVVLSLLFALAHRSLAHDAQTTPALGVWRHSSLVLEAYGRYTALLLWPDDLTLGRALLTFQGSVPQYHSGYAVFGGLSGMLSGLAAWRLRARQPGLSLALVAWPLLLLPVSGVVWLNYAVLVSPRFLYVPMIAVAAGVSFALGRLAPRPVLVALTAAGLLALGARSSRRAADFGSSEAFWKRELCENPLYTAAQEYFVSRELSAGRPSSALALARHFLQQGISGGAPARQRSTLLLKLLASALTATRDVDRESLLAIQRFALSVLTEKPAPLALPFAAAHIDVARDERLLAQLRESERTLRIIAAEAAERLGDEALARAEVDRALAGCEDCWTLLSTSALILARCGDMPRASELAERATRLSPPGQLTGLVELIQIGARWQALVQERPSAVHRAGFHVALGSFGRAHALAEPAFAEPPADPSGLIALAELAYQAGDVPTAERLLARGVAPEAAARALAAFAGKARWRDRPRPADWWLPDVAP